jgi:hypothetical protein
MSFRRHRRRRRRTCRAVSTSTRWRALQSQARHGGLCVLDCRNHHGEGRVGFVSGLWMFVCRGRWGSKLAIAVRRCHGDVARQTQGRGGVAGGSYGLKRGVPGSGESLADGSVLELMALANMADSGRPTYESSCRGRRRVLRGLERETPPVRLGPGSSQAVGGQSVERLRQC